MADRKSPDIIIVMRAMSKKFSALVILAALIGFGVFSLFGYHHIAFAEHQQCAQVLSSGACTNGSQDTSGTCAEFTLTILKKFSQSLPWAQKSFLAVLAASGLLLAVLVGGWPESRRVFLVIRKSLRLAGDNFIARFFKQLGNWLSLLEKMEPSLVVVV